MARVRAVSAAAESRLSERVGAVPYTAGCCCGANRTHARQLRASAAKRSPNSRDFGPNGRSGDSEDNGKPQSRAASRLERDFSSNRHPALGYCWSMIFSENRYPAQIKSGPSFFGIML